MDFWACGFPFIVMHCKLKYADMWMVWMKPCASASTNVNL